MNHEMNPALRAAVDVATLRAPHARLRFTNADVPDLVGFADRCERSAATLRRTTKSYIGKGDRDWLHHCEAGASQKAMDVLLSIGGTTNHHDLVMDFTQGSGPLATYQIVVETDWSLDIMKEAIADPRAAVAILDAVRTMTVKTIAAVNLHGVDAIGLECQCDAETHRSNLRLRALGDAAICADPEAVAVHRAGFRFTPSGLTQEPSASWVWTGSDMNPDFAPWFDQMAIPQMSISIDSTRRRTYRIHTTSLAGFDLASSTDPIALITSARRLSVFNRPPPTPMITRSPA